MCLTTSHVVCHVMSGTILLFKSKSEPSLPINGKTIQLEACLFSILKCVLVLLEVLSK